MTLNESSIYVGLTKLRNKLYQVQFLMTKADRIIFGRNFMEYNGECLKLFTLAFLVKEKRIERLEECIGWFAVLRNDIEFCMKQNIIKYKKRDADDGADESEFVNTQKIELFKIVAKLDNDMCKWRANLAKGKTICD